MSVKNIGNREQWRDRSPSEVNPAPMTFPNQLVPFLRVVLQPE